MSYILRKRIFCILFLLVLFGFAGINCYYGYEQWYEALAKQEDKTDVASLVSSFDNAAIESMYGRMNFIETYSYVQVVLGKNEFNNFEDIKDKRGFLHYASFFREEDTQMLEYAKRVKRLQDYAEQNGTKILFVVAPSKYVEGETEFDTGLPVNNPNDKIDELLFYLNRLQVKTIDCRKIVPNENVPYEEAFFKTDHHWTVPAAFEATKVLVDTIEEEFGEDLDPDDYWMNLDNFEEVTYYHGMCGSMGRNTGGNFVGLEDFTAYWPKYKLNCYREHMDDDGEMEYMEGDINEIIINGKTLLRESDIYSSSWYGLYLNTISNYEKLQNLDNPEGPTMLAIRDSYLSPVMAFMLPMFSEIDAIWTLEETDLLDIESYVKEHTFDYIIVEVYPYNINDDAFNFFKEDE